MFIFYTLANVSDVIPDCYMSLFTLQLYTISLCAAVRRVRTTRKTSSAEIPLNGRNFVFENVWETVIDKVIAGGGGCFAALWVAEEANSSERSRGVDRSPATTSSLLPVTASSIKTSHPLCFICIPFSGNVSSREHEKGVTLRPAGGTAGLNELGWN